ncbi:hypothetical protein [Ottowia sp.]|uniref:hypothetical protein n=1 Tax=Ottowia sp. TaxID=1898956 RepID=UPI00262B4219|nr:hypothetical protein [Ottowia sp.]
MTNDIAQQLTLARRDLREAVASLAAARRRFEHGSAKRLWQLQQRKEAVLGGIKGNRLEADALKKELGASKPPLSGIQTQQHAKKTKAYLRSIEDDGEHLRKTLVEVNNAIKAEQASAADLHSDYLRNYEAAYQALARQRAWEALASHGEPIAAAIAILACVPLASDALTAAGGSVQISRANFVWHELTRMAAAVPTGPTDPSVERQLGVLDTGPFEAPNMSLATNALMNRRAQPAP